MVDMLGVFIHLYLILTVTPLDSDSHLYFIGGNAASEGALICRHGEFVEIYLAVLYSSD